MTRDPLLRVGNLHRAFTIPRSPNYRTQPWPLSIDDDPKINNLALAYECSNDIERAHVFINRGGAIFPAHDFAVAWRATKFESAKNFGSAPEGTVPAYRTDSAAPRLRAAMDAATTFSRPIPASRQAQYDSLALVYTVASRRAGFWLIPAFHSVLDEGIRNKHDDPQNFRLDAFAQSLDNLVGELRMRTAAKRARRTSTRLDAFPSRRTGYPPCSKTLSSRFVRACSSISISCSVRPAAHLLDEMFEIEACCLRFHPGAAAPARFHPAAISDRP